MNTSSSLNPLCLADSSAVGFNKPFRCCQLHNFVGDGAPFLRRLQDELLGLDFIEKNNDLYKFHQTDDLKKQTAPHVSGLRRLLTGPLLGWLRDVTGIPLSDKVDMGCSQYEFTGKQRLGRTERQQRVPCVKYAGRCAAFLGPDVPLHRKFLARLNLKVTVLCRMFVCTCFVLCCYPIVTCLFRNGLVFRHAIGHYDEVVHFHTRCCVTMTRLFVFSHALYHYDELVCFQTRCVPL